MNVFKHNYFSPAFWIAKTAIVMLSKIVRCAYTVLTWVLWRNRTNGIEKEVYYQELALAVTETEKSHSLPSAHWRPRKVHGVIQSAYEGLGTRRADDVTPRLRAGEDEWDIPAQAMTHGKKGTHSSFFWLLFCLVLSRGWMMPRHAGWASYFTQSIDSNAHLIQNHPCRHTQE